MNAVTEQQNTHDIIVSGGGLSGLLTAIGIMQECPSCRVAIIEPSTTNKLAFTENFDDRCLALSYGSLQLLQHWQVWSKLKPQAWPIKNIITSDRGHVGKTIMRASDFNLNAMGYVAGMKNIGKAFSDTLAELSSGAGSDAFTWYNGCKIENIANQTDQVIVTLSDQRIISAKLLVIAEGANSPSRDKLHIGNDETHYNQSAIIANVKVTRNSKTDQLINSDVEQVSSLAFERFTANGPIAFLPISEQHYSVVWSVEPSQVDNIMAMDEDLFNQKLQAAFGFAAGKIESSSHRASYPLVLKQALSLAEQRCVLIGNAAHTIHPIAGQGFNLGLRDIAVLVQLIKQSVASNSDIGQYHLLKQFEKLRKQDIERVTQFTDGLVRLFSLPGRTAALARTAGLMMLQKFDSLQHWLAMHFMSSSHYGDVFKQNK